MNYGDLESRFIHGKSSRVVASCQAGELLSFTQKMQCSKMCSVHAVKSKAGTVGPMRLKLVYVILGFSIGPVFLDRKYGID